jgi:hypothetical protein
MLGVTALLLVSACASSADDAKNDARAVYCLAPARGAEFLQASLSLDVAAADPRDPTRVVVTSGHGGTAVNAAEMDRRYHDTFDRVCDAMMTADSVGSPGGSGAPGGSENKGGEDWVSLILLPVLLALLGAGLSLLGQLFTRTMTRRDEQRADLREALTAYENSAEDYLEAWRGDPETSHEEVAGKRRELVGVMRLLSSRGAPPGEIQRLAAELPLAEPLPAVVGLDTTAPSPVPQARRAEIVRRERDALDGVIPRIGSLASAAWWRRPGGRG